MTDLFIDPTVVRAVLDDVTRMSGYAAAKKHDLSSKTVYRWIRRREHDPAWPTDEYVAEWHRKDNELAARRRRNAALKRDYNKRVYVARGPMQIDATGTTRRVRALYALGWTSTQLAPRLGVSTSRVGHLASGQWAKVHRVTAAKVAVLYDDLSMTAPQDPDGPRGRVCRVHDRQRRQSAAKGWAPPLAWDDIDDPTEQPTDWHYQPASRDEVLADLDAREAGVTDACRVLDLSRAALQKWCGNHGLADLYRRLASREYGGGGNNRKEVA